MYRWVVYVIIHLKLFKYVKSLPKNLDIRNFFHIFALLKRIRFKC